MRLGDLIYVIEIRFYPAAREKVRGRGRRGLRRTADLFKHIFIMFKPS